MQPGDLVKRKDEWRHTHVNSGRLFLMRCPEKYNEVVCEFDYDRLALVVATRHVMWTPEIGGDFALLLYEGTYGWMLCGELVPVTGDPAGPTAG
jgi:hypothetical protein